MEEESLQDVPWLHNWGNDISHTKHLFLILSNLMTKLKVPAVH